MGVLDFLDLQDLVAGVLCTQRLSGERDLAQAIPELILIMLAKLEALMPDTAEEDLIICACLRPPNTACIPFLSLLASLGNLVLVRC